MRNKLFFLVILFLITISCEQKTGISGLSKGTSINKRVEHLLKKMTLDEKIGQLNQYTSRWEMTGPAPENSDSMFMYNMIKKGQLGSMLNVVGANAARKVQTWAVDSSRLGIPLILGYDVIHGLKTMFPIPLAEAASWDPQVAYTSSRIAAEEASASGINWTFAPMLDIARDARWGRIMEGSGEDPYLGSKMAVARVEGFQGDNLASENTIAACAKHFAAYGFVEAGREYNTVDISEYTLQNIVLPPFKAAVNAGVATVMNAFNTLNGTPATMNIHLQRDLLKGDWNFKGFVVSDWASINELILHGVAANKKEAARLAITAGSDMDMEGNVYIEELKNLVENNEVDETLIDDAVRRVLRVKFELGLFDDPFKYCNPKREKEVVFSSKNLAASRNVARKSIVLLKNSEGLLPLSKTGKKIAVIGELAKSKDVPLGSWRGKAIPNSAVSLLEGIENVVGTQNVTFAKGPVYIKNKRGFTTELEINTTDRTGMKDAVSVASKANVVVMALGEDCFQTGEGRSQTNIALKGFQLELLKKVFEVNKNVVVVLMNGRPIQINWMAEHVPAILETWFLGSQSGNAIADVLFGDYNPAGKLPVTFPRAVGQEPLYYNHLNTGRADKTDMVFWSHYTDESNAPLFPFGYGLSYTTFHYSNLKLSSKELLPNGKLTITATIENTGERTGEEVVQLYVRDLVGSISRPVKELKGFQKIKLKAGEKKEVTFELSAKDLQFFGAENRWKTEPGEYRIWVGTNSAEGLESGFTLK